MIKTKESKRYVRSSKDPMRLLNLERIFLNPMKLSWKLNPKIFLSVDIFPNNKERN